MNFQPILKVPEVILEAKNEGYFQFIHRNFPLIRRLNCYIYASYQHIFNKRR